MIGQTKRDRAGRQEAVRPARRDGHRREHPAHHRVDHEQEDRRGHRRARARRQDRQRGVHEDRGRLAAPGRVARRHRPRLRRADRGRHHGHARAAWPGRWECASKSSSAWKCSRAGDRPISLKYRSISRPACWCWGGWRPTRAEATRKVEQAIASGRRARAFPADHRVPGRRPARGRRLHTIAHGRRAPGREGAALGLPDRARCRARRQGVGGARRRPRPCAGPGGSRGGHHGAGQAWRRGPRR